MATTTKEVFTITHIYSGGDTIANIQYQTANDDGTTTASAEDKVISGADLTTILNIVNAL